MEQFNKEDVKTAFREIAKAISVLAIHGIKIAGSIIAAFVVFSAIGYLMFNWFFTILALVGIAAFCFWFYLEMLTAKSIREYEEQQAAWSAEKNKPAHKEQL